LRGHGLPFSADVTEEASHEGATFDGAAAEYDGIFTGSTLGRWMRERVWVRLDEHFSPGMRILELGCGTGEDAVWLAKRGVRVTATDASQAMLSVARAKAAAAGVGDSIEWQTLDLGRLDSAQDNIAGLATHGAAESQTSVLHFDGALSNFGALNCVGDLQSVAELLGNSVRPGGRVVLVVMGPWCPWEIAWYAAHGQFRDALRRLRSGGIDAFVGGRPLHVWYPPVGRLGKVFAPWFRHQGTFGIGALLPPPYLGDLVTRWPRLFRRLNEAEERVSGWWPWNRLNDHYLVEFERK